MRENMCVYLLCNSNDSYRCVYVVFYTLVCHCIVKCFLENSCVAIIVVCATKMMKNPNCICGKTN